MNMGYTKDALLITTMCVMIWSILAKSLSLVGMRLMKRWLFVLVSIIEKYSLDVTQIYLVNFTSFRIEEYYLTLLYKHFLLVHHF